MLPVSTTGDFADLGILFPKGSILLSGGTARIPMNEAKPSALCTSIGLLVSRDHQERRGVTMCTGITDPAHLEEVGLLLYNEGKEEYVWNHMSLWQ